MPDAITCRPRECAVSMRRTSYLTLRKLQSTLHARILIRSSFFAFYGSRITFLFLKTVAGAERAIWRMPPRRERSARPPSRNRVYSRPTASLPPVWLVPGCPLSRSVARARLPQEPAGQSPFRCPEPTTEAAFVHTGFPPRSAPLARAGRHCELPRLQSGGLRPGPAERDYAACPLRSDESRDNSDRFDRQRALLRAC